MATRRKPIEICGEMIYPGERRQVSLDVAKLYTHTSLELIAEVVHGRSAGPTLLVTSAIHGDELNGVEICRQLLKHRRTSQIKGTLIVVPVVNIFGFIHHSRYLPDRRDLNRCFPGSPKGSVGGRMAHLFQTEFLKLCTHAIDLHTGAIHRSNLPQIRANVDNDQAREMAEAFAAPVVIDAKLRDGSLRACADQADIPLILYEAGEALRFDDSAIKGGVRGILNVMRHLGMLPPSKRKRKPIKPVTARTSYWVRAEHDGTCRFIAELGQRVAKGDLLALIASPFNAEEQEIRTTTSGIVIGRNNIPLVHEGDALFHIARFDTMVRAHKTVEAFRESVEGDPLLDQPEPLPSEE